MGFISGIFQRLHNFVNDRDNNVKILAQKQDEEWANVVGGINAIVSQTQGFTGAIKGTNGSSSAPAYSFTSDPNTGIYRSAENNLSVSAGTVQTAEFTPDFLNAKKHVNVSGVGNYNSGSQEYGVKITGPTPAIGLIDSSSGSGSGLISYSGDSFYLLSDTENDGQIGATTNTSDEVILQISSSDFEYKNSKVWTQGNDGAGSGLDADTLDGQQGSFYQNAGNINTGVIDAARLPTTLTNSVTEPAGGMNVNYTGDDFTVSKNNIRVDVRAGSDNDLKIAAPTGGYLAKLVQTGISTANDLSARLGFYTANALNSPTPDVHGYIGYKLGDSNLYIESALHDIILKVDSGRAAYVNGQKILTEQTGTSNVRLGSEDEKTAPVNGTAKADVGNIMTGIRRNSAGEVTAIFQRPLQVLLNGSWQTVSQL